MSFKKPMKWLKKCEDKSAEEEGVRLDEAAQKQSGILVGHFHAAQYRPLEAYSGVVVDPKSLLEAQQRWDAIKRQIVSAEVLIQQRTQELTRTQGLYDHGRNAAAKDVEAAKSALAQAQQQAQGFDAELRAVIDAVRLQWGDAVAQGFENRPSWVQKWMQRHIDVIQFALPAGMQSQKQTWLVEPNPMDTSHGLTANLLGRATQALPGLLGENRAHRITVGCHDSSCVATRSSAKGRCGSLRSGGALRRQELGLCENRIRPV